jgi:membrane dipeptidase
MNALHEKLMVIDGLIISKFGPDVFRAMRAGGITAANCTCSVWEDFETTMKAVAQWKGWFRDYSDLIIQVYEIDDIKRAKKENKTGIILGWQNAVAFNDHLPFVDIFHELGLRVVQFTYNTATSTGSGCYETHDGGLTDFGRNLVDELNRVGILIDLSHVGGKTSADIVAYSKRPVAYTHCLPAALKSHPRNKTDEQLRAIADRGGFVGVTAFPPFLKRGASATIDDIVEAIEHVIGIVGEDRVGVGTDFTQGHDKKFFDYITHDKGFGRKLTDFGDLTMPKGFQRLEDFPNLTKALENKGWSEARIAKIMGENWINFFSSSWSH